MFWLFLGKSALKKSPFAKTAKWILIAIPLLLLMLSGLGCVALLSTVVNPVNIAKTAVQAVANTVTK